MRFSRLLFLLLAFSLCSPLFAKNNNQRWEDKSYQTSRLIVHYFRAEKLDSVDMLLNYWERECGLSEPVMRFKILYAIHNNSFSESLYDNQIFGYLMKYKARVEKEAQIGTGAWMMQHSTSEAYPEKARFVSETFNRLTMTMAVRLRQQFKIGDPRYFFCQFYNQEFNSALEEVQTLPYRGSRIQAYAEHYAGNAHRKIEEHYAVYGSMWQPQSALSVLGSHPVFGIVLGLKRHRYNLDIVGEMRIQKAAGEYQVLSQQGLQTTDEFFGGYAGVEVGVELFRAGANEFNLLAGLGYEGFDAVTGKGEDGNVSLSSSNASLGLGYRFFFKPYSPTYLGAQIRYQMLNYQNDGGTDLSGNAVQLRLIFGRAGNGRKNAILRSFGK